jgi:subtilase family protein/fibronectin type III domain protein/PA domain-containing protein/peptidase inhibitor I9
MREGLRVGATLTAVALMSVLLASTAAARQNDGEAAPGKGSSGVYIVQLDEPPVVAYEGGIAGLAATAPARGQKINPSDAKVQRYAGHLRSRHNAVANSVGAAKFYDYEYAFNGFAARLTKGQAARLRGTQGVLSVERDQRHELSTDNTPSFLGLNAPGGIWSQLGGQGSAGEDVVIGVVDTGIWPEHPSFSPAGYGPPPADWHGSCQTGERFSQSDCNNKLIGARYYLSGFTQAGIFQEEFLSPRDADGHGTHTASTAGGNSGVSASVLGNALGTVSGIAPRARVAAYKACWNGDAGGCFNSDTVAAIDQAVADGVDVINYSISGGQTPLNSVSVAFLFANDAGVYVSASAGNSGPGPSTVNHISPWYTTVAASTQNRSFVGTATLGGGGTHQGVTLTAGLGSTPLVDSADAGSELCFVGGLNPAVVAGKIVLCQRGVNARVEKSLAVKDAGGVGMILYNVNDVQSLNTDNHYVPTLHVNFTSGSAIKKYIDSAGTRATASLSGGQKVFGGGNTMADFSSRGPNLFGSGDVLKPDTTNVGVNVLAGASPEQMLGAPGQFFQAISGTSMSSPHNAGVGALLKDLHPDWTPEMIKSAIMTTARQNLTKEDGSTPADPFDFGGGHAVPNSAADPGLVYKIDFDGYRAWLRSQGQCRLCFGSAPAPQVAATDLNLPSITVRSHAGVTVVKRTVTNVGPARTYTVSVDAPRGVDVSVNPTQLTLATGASATYEVTLTTNRRAVFNQYAFGSLTWSDARRGGHSVRSPLVVRPVRISAPASITGTGVSGSDERTITFGYQGPFAASPQGLVAPTTETRTVVDDPTNNFDTSNPNANQGIQVHDVSIAAGTTHVRWSLFDEFTDGNDDLDVYVYRVGTGNSLTLVGFSAGGTSAEQIDLASPAAGAYKVYVHGWQTDGADAVYTLFSWLVPSTAAGNLTVTSSTSSATVGGTATLTVTWSGLTAGTRYLGRIRYSDGTSEFGSTLVNINA